MNEKFIFYYDESYHTRHLTRGFLDDVNDCDSYIGGSIGWNVKDDCRIKNDYEDFENKYKKKYTIPDNKELKSDIFKRKTYGSGVASFKNDQIEFYDDYFTLLEDDVHTYFFVSSKLEYCIVQLVWPFYGTCSPEGLVYTLTKAVDTYRPNDIITALFDEDQNLFRLICDFMFNKIQENSGLKHKEQENYAFTQCVNSIKDLPGLEIKFDWFYEAAFWGLEKLGEELGVEPNKMYLVLDNEGSLACCSKTLQAARNLRFKKVIEKDSNSDTGIRCADLFCGFIAKMIRALEADLRYQGEEYKEKKLLSNNWFKINERQFSLYKKIAYVMLKRNGYYYSSYASIYFDSIVKLIGLLEFFDSYDSYSEYINDNDILRPEKYNYIVCTRYAERYKLMGLPDDPQILKAIGRRK